MRNQLILIAAESIFLPPPPPPLDTVYYTELPRYSPKAESENSVNICAIDVAAPF